MKFSVKRLERERQDDFFRVHNSDNEMGWCFCTAWWVPTWEDWSNRTAEQNHELRESLFREGTCDGYLLYADDKPVGWCQCCQRDLLPKIRQTYNLVPDHQVWAVSCFYIHPRWREIGLAHFFLAEILKDLSLSGITTLQAFPHCGRNLEAHDICTGPESVFVKSGFRIVQEDPVHPVYELTIPI